MFTGPHKNVNSNFFISLVFISLIATGTCALGLSIFGECRVDRIYLPASSRYSSCEILQEAMHMLGVDYEHIRVQCINMGLIAYKFLNSNTL